MPYKPKHPCAYPNCPVLIPSNERYCKEHKKLMDKSRPNANQRGYDARWRKVRLQYLRENPLCVECLKEGKVTPATVVDHIKPHHGDKELFWDRNNWQALCEYHHNVKTAKEDGGFGNKTN